MTAAPRLDHEEDGPPSIVPHIGVALIAGGLFALIARRVIARRTRIVDNATHNWVQARRSPELDVAVKPVTVLSLPLLVMSATAVLALWLRRERRGAAALAVGLTPLIAAAAGQSFTTFLPQRNPPDAGASQDGPIIEPSFPSGHTTGVTAEALTVAYVLAREGMLPPQTLAPLIAWPLVVGTSRVLRGRHWVTDIVAAFAAGTAVAAAMSLLYEAKRWPR
jgi:membrane-associated phospholipid phosphatase